MLSSNLMVAWSLTPSTVDTQAKEASVQNFKASRPFTDDTNVCHCGTHGADIVFVPLPTGPFWRGAVERLENAATSPRTTGLRTLVSLQRALEWFPTTAGHRDDTSCRTFSASRLRRGYRQHLNSFCIRSTGLPGGDTWPFTVTLPDFAGHPSSCFGLRRYC